MTQKLRGETSKITVRTFAEGMLARLAHDLELSWPVASAEADPATGSGSVVVDAASLKVVGARKGDVLDEGALSAHDRAEIAKKLLSSIGADSGDGHIRAKITMASPTAKRATIEVTLPCGRATSDADVTITETDGVTRAKGTLTLSLRALGVPDIKGPLGAFRLKDRIEISFTAELA